MATKKKYLGIEIGGTKLQLLVGDMPKGIEKAIRYTIDPAGGAENIRKQISEGLKVLNLENDITATGVGFGGPVDWTNGIIRISHHVEGWANFNLSEWLNELTGKPVFIDNDANIAALAEASYGSGKNHERVFYLTIGSGIGGGMIVNGKIYHGRTPGEAELGHIRLNKTGDTLESKCSGWAINKKVRAYIDTHPQSRMANLFRDQSVPEANILSQAMKKGDEAAQKIIDDISDDLAFSLSHVVHLFHPDVIIIGGGISLMKEYIRQPIELKLPQYLMQAFLPAPLIHLASLGEYVVPLGAIALAQNLSLKSKKSDT
jgi:glucokinase